MSEETGAQQGRPTPRAKHKHSRSGAGPTSDSEALHAHAHTKAIGNQKKGGGRRNQQARNAPQAIPTWQDSVPPPAEGFFDANGTFVNPVQRGQAPGAAYMSDGAHVQGATHPNMKRGNNKVGKNVRHVNGARTPPQATSEQEHFSTASNMPSITPGKATAYAGPTFHASPAANALPIPKFFSKSVPSGNAKSGLQARMEQEPEKSDESDKADSPPVVQAVAPAPVPERANESPLDFLFKADKEQKAKRQSLGAAFTPAATRSDNFLPQQPALGSPWQSIYGTGPRNHHRQPSNGSGRDMFMMELDGRGASPRANHFSPPPPLPRLPNRSASDQYAVPQLSPQANFHNARPQSSGYSLQQNGYQTSPMQEQRPVLDQSFSPFNRGGPYPTPRSAETTPVNQQYNAQAPQNGFHYGNRNLSPLFKAAKQDPMRPPSHLRQEVLHGILQVAELPDSSPSRPTSHRQASTEAEKRALQYLQTQVPTPPAMPTLPLPPARSGVPSELDASNSRPTRTGVTPPGVNANTKSIEDDLRRMLKLTGSTK